MLISDNKEKTAAEMISLVPGENGLRLAIHEANYELDNEVAGEIAIEKLELMREHPREARAIVEAARSAIEADGVTHPAEFRALAKVKLILRLHQD